MNVDARITMVMRAGQVGRGATMNMGVSPAPWAIYAQMKCSFMCIFPLHMSRNYASGAKRSGLAFQVLTILAAAVPLKVKKIVI